MLYKKYHRNFVKQFKKGTKFRYCHGGTKHIVEREPYYDGIFKGIRMTSGRYSGWNLIFPDGQLVVDIDVVQEISQELR